MKTLLKKFKDWANQSKLRMLIASILLVVITALPFATAIYFITTFIQNEIIYMILDAVLLCGYGVSFIYLVTHLNKL